MPETGMKHAASLGMRWGAEAGACQGQENVPCIQIMRCCAIVLPAFRGLPRLGTAGAGASLCHVFAWMRLSSARGMRRQGMLFSQAPGMRDSGLRTRAYLGICIPRRSGCVAYATCTDRRGMQMPRYALFRTPESPESGSLRKQQPSALHPVPEGPGRPDLKRKRY
jgi:hypothetical protein